MLHTLLQHLPLATKISDRVIMALEPLYRLTRCYPYTFTFLSTMSTIPNPMEPHVLQQSIQLASYRAGSFKLSEQFQPWAEYLQTAIQTAARYGFAINAAEAEGALECLFEINPQTC